MIIYRQEARTDGKQADKIRTNEPSAGGFDYRKFKDQHKRRIKGNERNNKEKSGGGFKIIFD